MVDDPLRDATVRAALEQLADELERIVTLAGALARGDILPEDF